MKWILLALSVLVLTSVTPAQAQKQNFFQTRIMTGAGVSQRYSHRGTSTTAALQSWIYPVDVRFNNFYVYCTTALTGDSQTFTVQCGGNTPVACTMGAGSQVCIDTTDHSGDQTCVSGQLVSVKSQGTVSSTGAAICFATAHVTDTNMAEIDDAITWSGTTSTLPLVGQFCGPGDPSSNGNAGNCTAATPGQAQFAFAHDATITSFTVASSALNAGQSITFRLCKVTGNVNLCAAGDATNGDTGMTGTITASQSTAISSSCSTNCSATYGQFYVVRDDAVSGMTCSGGTNPGTSCTSNAQCTGGGQCQTVTTYNFQVSATGGGQTVTATRTQNTTVLNYMALIAGATKPGSAMRIPLAGTAKNLLAWADAVCAAGANAGLACTTNGDCPSSTCAPWTSAITHTVCNDTTSSPACSGLTFTQGAGATTGTGNGGTLSVVAGNYIETELGAMFGTSSHWLGTAFEIEGAAGAATPTPTPTQTVIPTTTPTARPGCCKPTPAPGAAGNSACPTPNTETCPANFLFMPFEICQNTLDGSSCACQQ